MAIHNFPVIPDTTAAAMGRVLGAQNLYRVIGDDLEQLFDVYTSIQPLHSFPTHELLVFRLSLVTVFQFLESLSDESASHASRVRGDWKYALRLPLSFSGFSVSILQFFHCATVDHDSMQLVFADIMQWIQNHPRIQSPNKYRFTEHIGAAVCRFSWMEATARALSEALALLAAEQPQWLRTKISLARYSRYAQYDASTLPPREEAQQQIFTQTLVADIRLLLQVLAEDDCRDLIALPEVQRLGHLLNCLNKVNRHTQHDLGCMHCASG